MNPRRAHILSQLLSCRHGTIVALGILLISLNSTLLLFSNLLQHSNARFYHHGESQSYMSINMPHSNQEQAQELDDSYFSPNAAFRAAVSAFSSACDNISGKNQEHVMNSPPVDIVYTWVNGSDPRQMQALLKIKLEKMTRENGTVLRLCNETESAQVHHCYKDEETASRYQDNEEMRYSLRSVWNYAPWVRNIYIVTNGQIPSWLNLHHPRIHVVPHTSIFANLSHLPTFSSPAIEANLHRIPGLSEHFVYLNDDVMFGRPVSPSDFYTYGTGQRVYFAWPVPDCAEGCGSGWLGDGFCDVACNVSSCNFDNGDCINATGPSVQTWSWGSPGSTQTASCSPGCLDTWIGDRYCDRVCRNPECGMDAGDCGIDLVFQNIDGFDLLPSNVLQFSPSSTETPLDTLEIPTVHIGSTALGHDLDYSSVKYFNLTAVVGTAILTDSAYSNPSLIRVMTLSTKNKILMVLFNPNAQSFGMASNSSSVTVPMVSQNSSQSNTTQPESSASTNNTTHATNTAPISDTNSGKIFVTITAKSDLNIVTEYMFYIQLHQAPTAEPAASLQASYPTASHENSPTNVTEEPNFATTRSLLSIEMSPKESVEPLSHLADDSILFAQANPKLEEKTLRKVRRIGITQEQIDEERALLERSGNLGLDLLRNPDNPFIITNGKVSKRKSSQSAVSGGGRRLLDHYADSLKHVNNLLNQVFGSEARKVPAHMPHYLQKSVIQRMQTLWRREFEATSSHRTRAGDDMQYSFSYFYYYMSEKLSYDFEEVWMKELDLNRDGVLDANEMRTVAATLLRSEAAFPKPNPRTAFMNWNQWTRTHNEEPSEEPVFQWLRKCDPIWLDWMPDLANVTSVAPAQDTVTAPVPVVEVSEPLFNTSEPFSSPLQEPSLSSRPQTTYVYASERLRHLLHVNVFPKKWNLTRAQLLNCSDALQPLERHYKARLRNRFELGNVDDVAFVMVPTNRSSALRSMDDIRAKRNKFVCLNDNINHTDPHAAEVVSALHDFYNALFPLPSPFELAPGESNKFLHTDELSTVQSQIKNRKIQIYLLLAGIGLLLFVGWRLYSTSRGNTIPDRHRHLD